MSLLLKTVADNPSTALIIRSEEKEGPKNNKKPNNQCTLQGRIVIRFTPPCPVQNTNLIGGLSSFADRFMMQIADVMGEDYAQFKSVEHQNPFLSTASKMMNRTFQMIGDLERRTQRMSLDDEPFEERIQALLVPALDQVRQKLRNALSEMGVQSPSQQREKMQKIALFRQQAEEQFFRVPENIDHMIRGDQVMVKAAKGMLSAQDRRCIQEYWAMIAGSDDGHRLHNQCEERFISLVFGAIGDHQEKMVGVLENSIAHRTNDMTRFDCKVRYAEQYVKELRGTVKIKYNKLIQERNELQSVATITMLDYLLLQGETKGSACINIHIRQALEPIAQEHEEHVVHATKSFWENELKSLVEDAKKELIHTPYDEEFWYQGVTDLEWVSRMKEQRKKGREEHIQFWTEELEKRQRKYDNKQKYIHAMEGDPAKIRDHIPAITPYERTLCEYLHISPGSMTQGLTVIPEMRLHDDVLSIEYFLTKMHDEAVRKIQSFKEIGTDV